MTRRAFAALRVIRVEGKSCVIIWPQDFFQQIARKNEDILKSVNSIATGPILLLSLGQDLSMNTFVVSIVSLGADFL